MKSSHSNNEGCSECSKSRNQLTTLRRDFTRVMGECSATKLENRTMNALNLTKFNTERCLKLNAQEQVRILKAELVKYKEAVSSHKSDIVRHQEAKVLLSFYTSLV